MPEDVSVPDTGVVSSRHLRRFLKFLHTLGAIGLMGAMASLFVMLCCIPSPSASLPAYAAVRGAMGAVATWIFLPSLGLTLVAGLFAIAFNNAFQNAGWAWLKLVSGVVIFEAGFTAIQGPMQNEAALSASALVGQVDPSMLGRSLGAERASLLVLFMVATANVVLGIWRPRLSRGQKA